MVRNTGITRDIKGVQVYREGFFRVGESPRSGYPVEMQYFFYLDNSKFELFLPVSLFPNVRGNCPTGPSYCREGMLVFEVKAKASANLALVIKDTILLVNDSVLWKVETGGFSNP